MSMAPRAGHAKHCFARAPEQCDSGAATCTSEDEFSNFTPDLSLAFGGTLNFRLLYGKLQFLVADSNSSITGGSRLSKSD